MEIKTETGRKRDRHVTTDTNRRTQDLKRRRGSWYLICERRKTVWPSLWSLTTPQSYLLPCQYFTTAHHGLLVCPSSPSRCSPSEGVKGWQVPGGAARSLGVRFLRGQAVAVKQGGVRGQYGWSPEQEIEHRAAVPPNQLHLWAMTDSHACMGRPQSAFRVLPTAHHKSIILDLLHFQHKVNDSHNGIDKHTVHLCDFNSKTDL